MPPASAASSSKAAATTNYMLNHTHSRDKLSLCSHIIAEHFGPIAGKVATILLTRGRLSVSELHRYLYDAAESSASAAAAPAVSAPGPSRRQEGAGLAFGRPSTHEYPLSQRKLTTFRSGMQAVDDNNTAAGEESGIYATHQQQSAIVPSHPLAQAVGPLKNKLPIQHALMVLVQHNICWHVRLDAKGAVLTSDEHDAYLGTEYFEMNPNDILPRVRFGEYQGIALETFGEEGAELIELVLEHGKLEAADLLQRLSQGDAAKRRRIEDLIKKLLWATYLRPSTLEAHISRREKEIAYEKERRNKDRTTLLTPKLTKDLKQKVRERIEEEDRRTVFSENGQGRLGLVPNERKKRMGALAPNPKRSAMTNGKSSATTKVNGKQKVRINGGSKGKMGEEDQMDDEDEEKDASVRFQSELMNKSLDHLDLDPEIFLRVNYDRFDVHIRDDALARSVRDWTNGSPVVGRVFRSILQTALANSLMPSCSDALSDTFTIRQVESRLTSDILESQIFTDHDPLNQQKPSASQQQLSKAVDGPKKKRRKRSRSDDEDSESGSGSNNGGGGKRRKLSKGAVVQEVFKHFINLANMVDRQNRIIEQSGSGLTIPLGGDIPSTATFQVAFGTMCRRLKLDMLCTMIERVYGQEARRVFTVLNIYGKLDEKTIQSHALISPGDVRAICTKLFKASIIQLQEVPRTADRNAARTIFLYFIDVERAYGWLLDHFYKSIENTARRRVAQDAKAWAIVQRVETRDREAEGNFDMESMADILRDQEMAEWERLQHDRLSLTIAEARVERDAFLLSSLPG